LRPVHRGKGRVGIGPEIGTLRLAELDRVHERLESTFPDEGASNVELDEIVAFVETRETAERTR
jgi:hypothetical protein